MGFWKSLLKIFNKRRLIAVIGYTFADFGRFPVLLQWQNRPPNPFHNWQKRSHVGRFCHFPTYLSWASPTDRYVRGGIFRRLVRFRRVKCGEDDSLENSLAFWTTLETSRMQSFPGTIVSWPRASSPSSINLTPLPLASRQNNRLLANLLPIRVPILKIQNLLYRSINTRIVNF